MPPAHKRRALWLVALCAVCVAATVGYVVTTGGRSPGMRNVSLPPVTPSAIVDAPEAAAPPVAEAAVPSSAETAAATVPVKSVAPAESAHAAAPKAAFLLRHTGLDQSYGALAADAGTGAPASRQATSMHCERVYFAANRGVCLEADRGVITTYQAILFDASFQRSATVPLPGIPSRTRVSPDGRYASITVFISGHSYSGADFSTETRIIDSVTGEPVVKNLEQMQVWSNGARLESADFNFWGVTFTSDRNRFYASLGTKGVVYLVQGDIAANKVTVLKPGVECPSLSPDNTRLAFKKRVPGDGLAKWRLYVLDLATLTEAPVAENRFIDEQVEWLDNSHILYTQVDDTAKSRAVTDVWVVPSDGSGTPSILLREAASPTLVRRAAHAVSPERRAGL
jgi:hypothetical protein